MSITRTTCAAVAAGVLSLALAGCSDDGLVGQDVAEIKDQVLEDMRDAESVHLAGTINHDGQELGIDMGITVEGDCAGSITVDGATADIISGPDGTFMKGDRAFWEMSAPGQGELMLSLLGDKWALVPDSVADSFSDICRLENFIDELEGDEDEDGGEKGDTEEVNGREALEIIGEDEDTGDETSAWVATESPHYILRLTSDSETEGGAMEFTDYDEPVDTEGPGKDEFVDLSKPQ